MHRIGQWGVLVWPGRAGPNWEAWGGWAPAWAWGIRWWHRGQLDAAGQVAPLTHSTGDSPSAAPSWAAPIIMLCLCPDDQGISAVFPNCIFQLSCTWHFWQLLLSSSRALSGAGQGSSVLAWIVWLRISPCSEESCNQFSFKVLTKSKLASLEDALSQNCAE